MDKNEEFIREFISLLRNKINEIRALTEDFNKTCDNKLDSALCGKLTDGNVKGIEKKGNATQQAMDRAEAELVGLYKMYEPHLDPSSNKYVRQIADYMAHRSAGEEHFDEEWMTPEGKKLDMKMKLADDLFEGRITFTDFHARISELNAEGRLPQGRPAGSKGDTEVMTFQKEGLTVEGLEETLDSIMDNAKNSVVGQKLCQLYMWEKVSPHIDNCGNRDNRPKPLAQRFFDEFKQFYKSEKQREDHIKALKEELRDKYEIHK